MLVVGLLFLFSCDDDKPTEDSTGTQIPATGISSIDQLSQKIIQTPDDPKLYAARAAMWWENEGKDEAIADLEKAISLDSMNAEYHHILADFYLDYSKSRLALQTMEKVARLHPDRIPTWLSLAELQLILKQHENALFSLEHIRARDPQNAEMFFMFGTVFNDMGKTDQALNAYQTAVEQEPDLIDAWINLGKLFAEKENKIALRYFDNALEIDSNNIDALKSKAYYLANDINDLDGAIKLYKKVNVLMPQYEDGYYDLGLLYLDMDSLDRAYQSFDLAIKNAPTFVLAYYYRGIASEKKGELNRAMNDYQQALNLAPDFEQAQKALESLKEAVN